MKPHISQAQLRDLRAQPGRSALLFLTDKCPVGCSHCSVDSRPDSPTITDYQRFDSILEGLANRPVVHNVGISGGEPFVERKGLQRAVATLSAAKKTLVLYTSGVWARPKRTLPVWQSDIISAVNTVIMSTDAYHARRVDDARFIAAVEEVRSRDTWLIIQAIDHAATLERVRSMLASAFGAHWQDQADINVIPLLPYGRAALLQIGSRATRPVTELGRCTVLDSPVVRYDGTVVACCNERVQMGEGPDNLRERVSSAQHLNTALDRFQSDPALRVLGDLGAEALATHPAWAHLSGESFQSICDFCWRARSVPTGGRDGGPLLHALVQLGSRRWRSNGDE